MRWIWVAIGGAACKARLLGTRAMPSTLLVILKQSVGLPRLFTSIRPKANVLTQSFRSGWLFAPGFSQSTTLPTNVLALVAARAVTLTVVVVVANWPAASVTRRPTVC